MTKTAGRHVYKCFCGRNTHTNIRTSSTIWFELSNFSSIHFIDRFLSQNCNIHCCTDFTLLHILLLCSLMYASVTRYQCCHQQAAPESSPYHRVTFFEHVPPIWSILGCSRLSSERRNLHATSGHIAIAHSMKIAERSLPLFQAEIRCTWYPQLKPLPSPFVSIILSSLPCDQHSAWDHTSHCRQFNCNEHQLRWGPRALDSAAQAATQCSLASQFCVARDWLLFQQI